MFRYQRKLPFKKRTPTVAITTRASNGAIELGVRDTGPGIKGDSDTIFEPFRTTKAREVGLGLTVCKRIAEAHGGRIDVVSTAGSGARFTMRLPINDAPPIKEGGYTYGTPDHPSGRR